MRDMNHTLIGWLRRNPDPGAAGGTTAVDYRAIAHVFIEDSYMDSYPMMKADPKEARRVFKGQGYFVDKPFVHIHVDDIVSFLHGGGTMTPERFQEWTGFDLITFIWDLGPFPDYILYHMGARPGAGLPAIWDEAWAEEQASHQARARNLYEAIEKSIYKNRQRILDIAWGISYDVAQRIRKPGEQNNIMMWVVEALRESDMDVYK